MDHYLHVRFRMTSPIDLNQRVDLPGFNGTVEEFLQLFQRASGKKAFGTVLPFDLLDRLEVYALKTGMKKSEIVQHALTSFLDVKEKGASYAT